MMAGEGGWQVKVVGNDLVITLVTVPTRRESAISLLPRIYESRRGTLGGFSVFGEFATDHPFGGRM